MRLTIEQLKSRADLAARLEKDLALLACGAKEASAAKGLNAIGYLVHDVFNAGLEAVTKRKQAELEAVLDFGDPRPIPAPAPERLLVEREL